MYSIDLRKMLFGEGASLEIGKKLKEYGAGSALCIYDSGVKAAGLVDPIVSAIEAEGIRVVCCDKVIADPTDKSVDEIAALGRRENIDAVVAIGGGSSLDTAKMVNILLTNPGFIMDYIGFNHTAPVKPLFLIPTTAGTGSECTAAAILTDTVHKCKLPVLGKACAAELAIVDSALTMGLPKSITAYTGMDALCHAVEGYTSIFRNQIIGILNKEAVRLIAENLPKVVNEPRNAEARNNMCLASSLGGWSLTNCIVHMTHALGHAIGAHYHVQHGASCALFLPSTVEQLAKLGDADVARRIRDIGDCLGICSEELDNAAAGRRIGGGIRDLNKRIGIPPLRSYVPSLEDLLALTDQISGDHDLDFAPIKVTQDIIREVMTREYSEYC